MAILPIAYIDDHMFHLQRCSNKSLRQIQYIWILFSIQSRYANVSLDSIAREQLFPVDHSTHKVLKINKLSQTLHDRSPFVTVVHSFWEQIQPLCLERWCISQFLCCFLAIRNSVWQLSYCIHTVAVSSWLHLMANEGTNHGQNLERKIGQQDMAVEQNILCIASNGRSHHRHSIGVLSS